MNKSKEELIDEFKEELRRGAGGKFYKANPDGTLVVRAEGIEWFSNALDTHSQNREAEIRKEERESIESLIKYEASFNKGKDQFDKGVRSMANNIINKMYKQKHFPSLTPHHQDLKDNTH